MNLAHFEQLLADYLPAQLKEQFYECTTPRSKEIEFERVLEVFEAYKRLDAEAILKIWEQELENICCGTEMSRQELLKVLQHDFSKAIVNREFDDFEELGVKIANYFQATQHTNL